MIQPMLGRIFGDSCNLEEYTVPETDIFLSKHLATPSSERRGELVLDLTFSLFKVRRIPCIFGLFSDSIFFDPIFISKK